MGKAGGVGGGGGGWIGYIMPRGMVAICRLAVVILLFLTFAQHLIIMHTGDEGIVSFGPGRGQKWKSGHSDGEVQPLDVVSETVITVNEPLRLIDPEGVKSWHRLGERRLLQPGNIEQVTTKRKGDGYDKRLGNSVVGKLANELRELLKRGRSIMSLAVNYEDFVMAEALRKEIDAGRRLLGQPKRGSVVTPLEVKEKIETLKKLFTLAEQRKYDSKALIEKLKSKLESAEKTTLLVNMQSKLFSQMAAKAVPKSLHCLAMRLMMEWNARHQELDRRLMSTASPEMTDNSLYHYALFSDNVLAVSVVVNSTAQNAVHPEKHVFHIVTDKMNYGAIKAWFALNPMRGMHIDVRSLEDFPWINCSYIPVLNQTREASMRQYYFPKFRLDEILPDKENVSADSSTYQNFKFRNPKYLSILNHIRFYLPEIFPDLDRIVFLDDDVVVQKDLSDLWKVPMNGKVNLAVETCGEVFHRFHTYLNFTDPLISKKFDPQACGWAFGMNLFNLKAWRSGNFTEVYHYWQRANWDRRLWKLGTLPPALMTFYNYTKPVDKSWHVLGLGCNANVSMDAIDNARVIHYNGHAKPWLELAMLQYQPFWSKYVPYSHDFFRQCSISPS